MDIVRAKRTRIKRDRGRKNGKMGLGLAKARESRT